MGRGEERWGEEPPGPGRPPGTPPRPRESRRRARRPVVRQRPPRAGLCRGPQRSSRRGRGDRGRSRPPWHRRQRGRQQGRGRQGPGGEGTGRTERERRGPFPRRGLRRCGARPRRRPRSRGDRRPRQGGRRVPGKGGGEEGGVGERGFPGPGDKVGRGRGHRGGGDERTRIFSGDCRKEARLQIATERLASTNSSVRVLSAAGGAATRPRQRQAGAAALGLRETWCAEMRGERAETVVERKMGPTEAAPRARPGVIAGQRQASHKAAGAGVSEAL